MSQQKTCFFISTRMRLTFFIARAPGRREKEKKERDRERAKRRGKLRVVVSLAGKGKRVEERGGAPFSFVLPGVCLFFNAL